MLACNICESKAKYKLILNCGRFEDRIFFCEEHKPLEVTVDELDQRQNSTGKLIKHQIMELDAKDEVNGK